MNVTEAVLESIPKALGPQTVLIAGSGPESLPEWEKQGYKVTRLDIEPRTNPDICASMTNMGEIGTYDVVFCCHALEHLYPHEVYWALCEFKRVLNVGGVAIVLVPDLEDVKPTNEVLDYPESGAITGLHLFYGDHRQIREFPYMAHHCGFVQETLRYAFEVAGFGAVKTERLGHYNLMGLGLRNA